MVRVLIVEDSEEGRYLLQALLQGSGYEVTVTANGAEALEVARADPPDIIVSDIMMPIMDGFQLCREWKQDEELRTIPFVFYTAAYTSPQDQEFALSLGADRFIAKPTEPGAFVEMLRKVIREHEAGAFAVPREPTVGEEPIYLREYSERLVRKLEEKVAKLERANQELAVLHAIAATVSRSLELDTILQDALKHVLETMKLETGLIMLINEQTATARVAAHRGLSPAAIEEKGDIDLSSVALDDLSEQLDTPLIVEDVAVAPRLAQMAMRTEGLRSYVSIPLQAKGRLLGVINAFSYDPLPLRPVNVQLLSAIGDQVGVAIENARLFAEAQRRVDELVFLNQVGQILSSTLKLEQVLAILMDQTATMLDAEAGSVSLLDEESGELVYMVAAGPKAEDVK